MYKKKEEKSKTRLRVNDKVVVIAGKSKGMQGEVLYFNKNRTKVLVKGVNMRKRFMKPSQQNPKGGEVQIESFLHISNIQYWDSKSKKPSRIGYQINENNKKVRYLKASNKELI